MFTMVLKKMFKNRWMVLCLLIGVVIATAMMSSIPQYTGGILQKVLTKDLENYQITTHNFPGSYLVKQEFNQYDINERKKIYGQYNNVITNIFYNAISIPALSKVNTLYYGNLDTVFNSDYENAEVTKDVILTAMSDIDKHVNIIKGHLPSKVKDGDVCEVMLLDDAMNQMDLKLDNVYSLNDISNEQDNFMKVKVVGVFSIKNKSDVFWYNGEGPFDSNLFMDYSLFTSEFMKDGNCKLTNCEWYYAFDYHKINLNNIDNIAANLESQDKWLDKNCPTNYKITSLDTIKKYNERQKQLKILLWVLQVPVILMLVFYLFMVAQLIMQEEKNEIAVLKSRGSTRGQIFISYLIESILLSGISLIIGPLIGLWICQVMGASNGFLEFVQRSKLHITLNYTAYLYAMIAIGLFIVTMLLPAFFASKTTIVLYKQGKNKNKKSVFWKKYFIDILLLAVSCYGIYNYSIRQKIMNYNTGNATDLPIDPLLFIVSTLFILGIGLLFIRVYPYIIKLIFWIGKKLWSPTAYTSLLSVARSGGRDQFLILFLIFTLSIGIFNAEAARTINNNNDEKIKYSIGADVTLMPEWRKSEQSSGEDADAQGQSFENRDTASAAASGTVTYYEPDFFQYEHLSGVASAAKVYKRTDASVNIGKNSAKNVYLMGIVPSQFGKTAWFRTDLLPYHWYNYLNMMTKNPNALLLSTSFKKKYGVKLGDEININLGKSGAVQGIACAFIDYWPTYNPHQVKDDKLQQDLIVGNLDYIQSNMPIEPYEVWIKKKDGATSQQLYNDIKKNNLKITTMSDTSQEIIKSKNDPILQGINGALTLGFVVTMAITAIGFLIYWIMSIRSRVLQFGVLRAMGLSFKELLGMLIMEQTLISLIAILVGDVVGRVTSRIFVPMLQLAFNTSDQVPPFKVAHYVGDFTKIYSIIGIIVVLGLIALGTFISKIKINQAIKLGED